MYRLNKLLGDVVISQGGVVPFINPEVRLFVVCTARWRIANVFGCLMTAFAEQDAEGEEERRVTGGVMDLLWFLRSRRFYPTLSWFCLYE